MLETLIVMIGGKNVENIDGMDFAFLGNTRSAKV